MTTRNERLEAGKRFLDAVRAGEVLARWVTPSPSQFRPRCPECGKRIRGINHTDGSHHREVSR